MVLDTKYRDLLAKGVPETILYQLSVYGVAFGPVEPATPVPVVALYPSSTSPAEDIVYELCSQGRAPIPIRMRSVEWVRSEPGRAIAGRTKPGGRARGSGSARVMRPCRIGHHFERGWVSPTSLKEQPDPGLNGPHRTARSPPSGTTSTSARPRTRAPPPGKPRRSLGRTPPPPGVSSTSRSPGIPHEIEHLHRNQRRSGYLTARPSRDLVQAAHQEVTCEGGGRGATPTTCTSRSSFSTRRPPGRLRLLRPSDSRPSRMCRYWSSRPRQPTQSAARPGGGHLRPRPAADALPHRASLRYTACNIFSPGTARTSPTLRCARRLRRSVGQAASSPQSSARLWSS